MDVGRFEKLRARMVAAGMEKGFTHPEVVAMSQELDEMHNDIMRAERAQNLKEAANQ